MPRLEIGAGNCRRPEFIHTDLNIIPGHHLEVVCRGEQLPFISECFDYVYMLGVFEHFDKHESSSLLSECHRVLCKNGCLEFTVPDLEAVCKIILENKLPFVDTRFDDPLDYALSCLYGGQDRPGQLHKWGWTKSTVKIELESRNFSIVELSDNAYEPNTHLKVVARKL